MKTHVFDTHVTTKQGHYYHFDVLVKDETRHLAEEYANEYLKSLGVFEESIEQHQCRFCHSAVANPEVEKQITKQGYYILPLEGC